MKKRIISLLLALSMMISLVPVSALADTGGGTTPLAAGESVNAGHGLTINANGVPQGNDGANGTNWTYTSSSSGYGTLTLKSGIYDFSNQRLKDGMTINVETGVTAKNFKLSNDYNGNVTPKIDQPATLNNNGGTVEDAELHGLYNGTSINVNNSGTIKNSEFSNAEIVNEAGATIEGSSLVRADSSRTWLKNLGTVQECALYGVYFRDGKYGTITDCVSWSAFPDEVEAAKITIDGDARWTITDPRMPDRLASYELYIVGSPTLKIQIWDRVKGKSVPLSDFGGSTEGITTVEENGETWYQFTPDSSKADSFVLNVRKEHQLTVTGGGVIKAINGTDTTGSPTTAQVKETLKVTLEAPEQDGKTFKEWKVTAGMAPTNFVYKRNEYYNLIDNPTSFYMPEGDVTLEAIYYNEALVIGADGKPNTANSEPDGKGGWKGANWTYDGTTLTLSGSRWIFSKYPAVTCPVVLSSGTVLYGGMFENTVSGLGYITGGIFLNTVTVSAKNIDTGIFKTAPNGTTCYTVKAGDSSKLGVRVNGKEFVDFGTDEVQVVNRTGNFEFSVQLRNANGDVVKITNINGNEIGSAYGSHYVDNSTATEFTMPSANVVLNQEPTTTTYTLTLTDATANPAKTKYNDGDEITLTAKDAAEGEQFNEWKLDGLKLKENNWLTDTTIVVTITGNATAKATYKNKTYKLTLETDGTENAGIFYRHNGNLIGNDSAFLAKDDTAELKADVPEGKQFDRWELSDGLTLVDGYKLTDATIKIKMPGKEATAKAFFKDKAPTTYTLTVEGGKTSTGKTSEELKEGTVVTVDTNVPDDKVFTGWTVSDGATLTYNGKEVDLSENHLVFNMPAKSFTLTANFETARTNILFKEDGTLNLDGVKDYEGDGWWYDEDENVLHLEPQTETKYNFTHVNPQEDTSAELKEVNVVVWVNNNNAHIVGGTFAKKVCGNAADASIQNCTFKSEVNTNTPVKNCIFTKSSTITDIYIAENCLFEEKQDESKIAAKELTEESGATITATFDGCAGEISGTTLYFSGTPTLKVKVADGIVEKANDKPVGKADANGWYTVKAAEDDDGIVLTKGEKTTPNPDDQPKTYTVTVKGGTINNETEVKAEKDIKLTVDVDEKEVPEGMTFDVWSIRFPKGIEDTLTPSVNLHDPHMTFTMPGADITIEAQYRSSELPGEDDGPSTLGTMATVAVGGAAAGILVWQGVSLGVDSYLQLNLPKGVAVPANRRELVVLLWETAGKPEAALPSLYSDVPAEEIELQKATRWAIDNGLVKPADDSDASRFDPDRYVTKYDVFGAWLKLKKLMKL